MKEFLMAMMVMPLMALAGTWTDPSTGIKWTYTVSGGKASVNTGLYLEPAISQATSGAITVPSTLGGYSVTSIGDYAFYKCSELTRVTIPDGVTSIGAQAFAYCSGLKSVTIPEGVTSIDSYTFCGCSGLTSVTIPDGVTSIGIGAFYGCSGLTEMTIPTCVTSIRDDAFYNCSGLKSVTIPSSVTSIEGLAFANCNGLTSVHISDLSAWCKISFFGDSSNPLSYAHHLYLGDTEITELTIPDDVTSIGGYAFAYCRGLKSVTIHEGVTSIGVYSAFFGCGGLTSFVVAEGNQYYKSANGLLLTKDGKKLVCGVNGDVVIPDGVTSIGWGAFYGCSGLTSVTIPDGVTGIFLEAFHGCSGLTEVAIPSSVTSIGESAFGNCSGLLEVTIPSSVTSIGRYAFFCCSGLKTVWTDFGDSGRIKELVRNSKMSYSESILPGVTFLELPPLHVVTFDMGEHGKRIDGGELSQTIEHGGIAETPIVQADYGWEFDGWSCGFDHVTNDLNVAAQWHRLTMSMTVGNATWKFHAEGDGVVIENDGLAAVTGGENGSLFVPEQLDGKTVIGIGEGAFAGLSGIRSAMIPASIAHIGKDAFVGCDGLDTIKVESGDVDRVRQMIVDSGFDVSWVEFREKNGGTGSGCPSCETICLTVTNVVVNYILNSVQPQFVFPATSDAGFVNIIAEVKGGCVAVPATWSVNYPKFTEKFGTDFTKALAMKTGKKDGAGNPMFVWQDYVAGTDPTDETDVFTASITIVDGKVKVSCSPELDDARKALRKYTTWGKAKLTDKDWSVVGEGEEGDFNFFKVTVEMR